MLNSLPAYLNYLTLLLASATVALHSQELLRNGDFEGGRLPPWDVTTVAGSSATLVAENSPFQSVYAAGTSSLRVKDDDQSFDEPSVRQSFPGQPAILFGFDFKIPSPVANTLWYLAWEGENDTTAFFFVLGSDDGASISFNQDKIADLKPNVWYHVEGSADAPQQRIEGTIVNTLGDHISFQGSFPFGVKSELNGIVISDGGADPNAEILFDNFYSRTVTLQIALSAQHEQVLTWLAPNFTLQTTTTLGPTAHWTDIPGASGAYTNTFSDPIRFFRLTH